MDRSTPGWPSSHNGQTSVRETTSVCSTFAGHGMGTTTSREEGQNSQGAKDSQEGTANRRDPSSLQYFRCQGWAIWLGNAPPQPKQPTVGPWYSLPDPKPISTTMNATQRMVWPEVVPFLNPDPIACLVGCSNEAPVIVDEQRMTSLIDMGAQVSSISSQFCKDLVLQIQPLGQLLELEGTEGATIPYLRFMEVNLQIPGIKNYNENALLLVIPTTTYSEMVPIMVGSKIIDRAMSIITKGDLAKATMTWRQAHFGAVMSGSQQPTPNGLQQNWGGKGGDPFLLGGDIVEVKEFCLDDVWGPVHTTWKVTIHPFSTISMHAITSVKGHCMWVHMLTEPMPGPQLPTVVVLMVTHGELHLGSLRVPICLCNLGANSIEIPRKTVVGQVVPANQVPLVVLPTRTSKESNSNPQKAWVLEALDL